MMDRKYTFFPIFLGLVMLALAIPGLYITQEKFFYYWDYGGFQGVAIHQAKDIIEQFLPVLKRTIRSINLEYNYFYTIPLIPFIISFGYSRLSYVLSVSLIYQLPFSLVIGAIGSLLIRFRRSVVFWSVAYLCLFVPIVWAPTLRGYPDVGGALFIALAVWVYCLDTHLDAWWQSAVIGSLLAVAILYRRHFAYDVVAFYFAMSIQGLIYSFRSRKDKPLLTSLRNYTIRICLVGSICLGVMTLVGKPMLFSILTTDYGSLFSSYMLPAVQILRFFISSYGWIIWILVILGFSLGIHKDLLNRSTALFIILFSCISISLWVLLARQAGIHYTLHVSMFVVLGLAVFVWMAVIFLRGIPRLIIVTGLVIFLMANMVVGLGLTRLSPQMVSLGGRWFSTTYAPLIRPDYEEVIRLVEYLRSNTTESDVIYVVDSSERMNYDLLIKAEEALYEDQKLNVVVTPQIDSRDFYPLELLMQAKYVILTTPLQCHLSNPEEQKVVEVVYKAFTEEWEISQDFQPVPVKFNLAKSAILSIYQRINPTSTETAVRTQALMESFINHRPGKQPDWIILSSPPSASITMQKNGSTQVFYHLKNLKLKSNPVNEEESGPILLYTNELKDQVRIEGSVECSGKEYPITTNAPETNLSVLIFYPSGEIIQEERDTLTCSLGKSSFNHVFYFQESVFLVVSIHPPHQEDAYELSIQWALTKQGK
jgi:hypothetical protein